jgi:lysophospholipase L1-like esterase
MWGNGAETMIEAKVGAQPVSGSSLAQRSRPGRRWLGRVAYLLFLVLVAELALQVFYRLTTGSFLFTRAAMPVFAAEPHGGWMVKPHLDCPYRTPEFSTHLYTNSQGFRVSRAREEYAPGRDAGHYRVLLLGPSFAFGWGVNHEDTFAAQLQRMLNDAAFAERPVEIINRGVPALPAIQDLRWFQEVGVGYQPDLVIQLVYGSLAVGLAPSKLVVEDGYLVAPDSTLRQRAAAWAKSSAIVFYGWTMVTKLRSGGASAQPGEAIEGAGREMAVVGRFDRDEPAVRDSLTYYEELRRSVEASEARLLVVYFPLSYVVHAQDIGRWQHLGVRDVQRQVEFDREFAHYLNQRGIPCVNLTQELVNEAARGGQRLYYWLDVHWTPEGNRVAARGVADWLANRREWGERP